MIIVTALPELYQLQQPPKIISFRTSHTESKELYRTFYVPDVYFRWNNFSVLNLRL